MSIMGPFQFLFFASVKLTKSNTTVPGFILDLFSAFLFSAGFFDFFSMTLAYTSSKQQGMCQRFYARLFCFTSTQLPVL